MFSEGIVTGCQSMLTYCLCRCDNDFFYFYCASVFKALVSAHHVTLSCSMNSQQVLGALREEGEYGRGPLVKCLPELLSGRREEVKMSVLAGHQRTLMEWSGEDESALIPITVG